MKHFFDYESIASKKTQEKCLKKVIELAMSLPSGYIYTINVKGSYDKRRRVDVGGTYFDLVFCVWDIYGNRVLYRIFEDSDGTKDWNMLYNTAKEEITKLNVINSE